MKKKFKTKAVIGLALLLGVAMMLFLTAAKAGAACSSDADGDGFCDQEGTIEGFTCSPDIKDLFAILKTAKGSNLPSLQNDSWFDYLGGVELGVHQWTPPKKQTDRLVADGQNAVRVWEDNTTSLATDIILATTIWGTPNTSGEITVYTKRIEDYVTKVCSGKSCSASNFGNDYSCSNNLTCVKTAYKKQVIAHEVGHSMKLAPSSNAIYGGYHYAPADLEANNVTATGIMGQSVIYRDYGDQVVFYIPGTFKITATADEASLKLK